MWDIAGQERFWSITKTYYNNVKGIILMFDVTEQKTFEDLKKHWI